MGPLLIIELVFVIMMFGLCIETVIYYKKNENKKVEKIRKNLLIRIRLITILSVIIAILGIVNIIINR